MINDNTFRKARDLGSFSTTQSIRSGRDVIGPSDKVDIVKFTVAPSQGFRASSSFRSKGGSLNVSFFFRDPASGAIVPGTPGTTLKAGRITTPFDFPAASVPIEFFVRFDKPTAEVKYQFSLTPIP